MLLPLTPDQATDLVMVLGAAEAAFKEMADDVETMNMGRRLLNDYAQRARSFREEITRIHNLEQRT